MSVPLVVALVISIAVVMAAVSVIRRLEAETGADPAARRPGGADVSFGEVRRSPIGTDAAWSGAPRAR